MLTRKKTHDPVSIATMWAFEASTNATNLQERYPRSVVTAGEWQRARRLWAMVDRMRGVE